MYNYARRLIVTTLIICFLIGCGSNDPVRPDPEPLWSDIDLSSYEPTITRDPASIKPSGTTDYWEFYHAILPSGYYASFHVGVKCQNAKNQEKCISDFDTLRFLEEEEKGKKGFLPFIVSNTGDDSFRWDSIGTFLGTIDSKDEAMMLIESGNGYSFHWFYLTSKEEGAIREIDDGYEIIALKGVGDCRQHGYTPIHRFLLHVARDGGIQVLREQVYRLDEGCGIP